MRFLQFYRLTLLSLRATQLQPLWSEFLIPLPLASPRADSSACSLSQRLPYTIAENWDDYPVPYINFENPIEVAVHPQIGEQLTCLVSSRFRPPLNSFPFCLSDYTEELLLGKPS